MKAVRFAKTFGLSVQPYLRPPETAMPPWWPAFEGRVSEPWRAISYDRGMVTIVRWYDTQGEIFEMIHEASKMKDAHLIHVDYAPVGYGYEVFLRSSPRVLLRLFKWNKREVM